MKSAKLAKQIAALHEQLTAERQKEEKILGQAMFKVLDSTPAFIPSLMNLFRKAKANNSAIKLLQSYMSDQQNSNVNEQIM